GSGGRGAPSCSWRLLTAWPSAGTGGWRRIPRPGGHPGRGSTAGRSSSRSSFPGQGDRGGERLLVDGVGFGGGQGPGEDVGAGTVPQRKGAGVSGPALDLDAGPQPGGAGGAPDGEAAHPAIVFSHYLDRGLIGDPQLDSSVRQPEPAHQPAGQQRARPVRAGHPDVADTIQEGPEVD